MLCYSSRMCVPHAGEGILQPESREGTRRKCLGRRSGPLGRVGKMPCCPRDHVTLDNTKFKA